jgi:hypothetical protein
LGNQVVFRWLASKSGIDPIGSMVLLYMVTWIPSIYPSHVSIYTIHGSYGDDWSMKWGVVLGESNRDVGKPMGNLSGK